MASRSLGVLTLDLVAKTGGFVAGMDKSERASDKWRRQVKRNVDAVRKSIVVGASAAAAAITAITVSTVNSAREIQNLSRVANSTTGEFQKITYAAKTYGVEQEKVADILKDTSDKVGDFLQTGGGPLADFFENIAPQIGVTAEQFRDLSGSQALGLYVQSLQKANLSQNEMTFFMEAIASDATLLLPLFKDNAKELNRLSDEAENFGAVISDVDLSRLEDVRQDIDKLQGAFKGIGTEIALGALPAIKDLTDLLTDPETIAAAQELANAVVRAFTAATEAVSGTVGTVRFLSEELAAAVGGAAVGDVVRLNEQLDDLLVKRNSLEQAGGTGGRNRIAKRIEQIDEEIKKTRDLINLSETLEADNQKRLSIVVDVKTPDTGEIDTSGIVTGVNNTAIQESIKSYELQAELLGKNTQEQELYKLALQGATEEQLRQAESALMAIDSYKKQEESIQSLAEKEKELAREKESQQEEVNDQALMIADSLKSQEQLIEESYERRREIVLANTKITGEAQNSLLVKLSEDRSAQLQEIENARNAQIAEGYSVLFDVVSQYYDGMQGKQAGYARVALALGEALLDQDKREALQSIVANTQSAAMKAYDALSGIYLIGPALGAAAAAGIVVAGGAAAAKVTGLAHDGIDSVPQTGTWLLEKGERVTTEETSAKLDRTLDSIQKNRMEGGGFGGGNIRVVNTFDSEQVVGGYMGSDAGEQVIMNAVKKNQSTIKTLARN